jgi:hypothetical protein
MAIMEATDTITLVEGYDAMRIFLETVSRRHGMTDEEIEFIIWCLEMGRWLAGRSDDVARLAGGCTNCMQLPDTVKIAPPPNVIRCAPPRDRFSPKLRSSR